MQQGNAPSTHDLRVRERLLRRRTIDPLTGCWEWQGRRDRWGYGRITIAHHRYSVHRLSAALFLDFGLTSPLHILHRCHNPPCFCPDHLRPGTHQENMRARSARTPRPGCGERDQAPIR
jgi:HNH endonuclease